MFKYRKQVILDNLSIAFPEKSEQQRKAICHEFYHRFTDNFIELLKLISLSEKEIKRRFICEDEVMQSLFDEGLSADMILGHFFNWEFANLAYAIHNPFTQLVVYSHVSSSPIEKLMIRIRSRFGTKLIDSYKFKEQFKPFALQQKSFVLVADQSPRFIKSAFWLDFFGKKTAFTKGPETSARLANNAVVFCSIRRIKRGFYTSHLEIVTKAARETEKGEITRKAVLFYERVIKADPPGYLWSHRRWKHPFDPARDSKNLI